MPEILLVSKPLVPPWQDGGKNIVRDVALHTPRIRAHVMSAPGVRLGAAHVVEEPVFRGAGTFGSSVGQQFRVFLRLLGPDSIPIWHFFFAPNPRSSRAARAILAVRRRRTVQTVSSVPRDVRGIGRLVFAERVIALSASTAGILRASGVTGVRVIRPMVAPPAPDIDERRARVRSDLGLPSDVPLVVFPGDLEFGDAGDTVAEAAARARGSAADACVVFACREKTRGARDRAESLRSRLADRVEARRVAFVGQVPDPRALFAEASVVVLPASSTYAKTDLPFAVLEAMSEGTPVVLADAGPARECLADPGDAAAPDAGVLVPPRDPAALWDAVARLVADRREAEERGRAARRRASQAFGAGAFGEAHAQLYEELERAKGPPA